MEKVTFVDPQTKESIDFFVVEETQVNGTRYFFVTEEEDGDCDAYIFLCVHKTLYMLHFNLHFCAISSHCFHSVYVRAHQF